MESIGKLRRQILGLLPASCLAVLQNRGLVYPSEGTITLEGLSLEDGDLKSFRDQMGDLAEDLDMDTRKEISAIFYGLALVVMRHYDEAVVTQLLQEVLPMLLHLWREQIVGKPEGTLNWPKELWGLVVSLSEDGGRFGPAETTRSLMVVSRCLALFLPFSRETGVDYEVFNRIDFDLRRDDGLAMILLDGLVSGDGMARKEALRILKSIVAFSTAISDDAVDASSFTDEDSSSRIFCWKPADKPAWIESWTGFFLLYESLQQPQVHIITPMLALLGSFLQRKGLGEAWLGLSWWETLLTVGFRNDSIAVRRATIESVLRLGEEALPALHSTQSFVFGEILRMCDTTAFYFPIDTTRYMSKFGELVVGFYSRFLASIPADGPEGSHPRVAAINGYLQHICDIVKGPSPSVYLLLSLFELAPLPSLTEATLESCIRFASSTSTFHNQATRRLVKAQLLRIMTRFGDPAVISYRAASQAIEFFSAEQEGFVMGSGEYEEITGWLKKSYGSDFCLQSLKNEVERYFSSFGILPAILNTFLIWN